jgi:hypothetical protein
MKPIALSSLRALAGLALLLASSPLDAGAQLQIVGSNVIEQRGAPGEELRGTITIQNVGAAEQEARVYLRDYAFHADGRSEYGDPGTSPRSNAGWMTLSASQLRLAPGQSATVTYALRIPAKPDAPPSGSYWSLVMIEGIAPGSAESSRPRAAQARVQMGLQVSIRHGVQVATHVTGGAARELVRITNPAVSRDSTGAKQLTFDVSNAGELAVRPVMRVELYDEQGQRVAATEQQRGLLYPGSSLRQQFGFGALPSGTYRALVVADTDGEEMFGARFTLKL